MDSSFLFSLMRASTTFKPSFSSGLSIILFIQRKVWV